MSVAFNAGAVFVGFAVGQLFVIVKERTLALERVPLVPHDGIASTYQ